MVRCAALLAALLVLTSARAAVVSSPRNAFAFLAPDVVIDAGEQTRLDAGETFVRVLPGRDGHLALSAAVRVNVSPERLIAWSAQVERLQRGRYVPQIGRFSVPPRIEDLAALTFDTGDIEDIRRCRPGKCGVKLNDAEIIRLQAMLGRPGWKDVVQHGLRDVVLQRAVSYLAAGDAGALPYHDDPKPLAPEIVFGSLIDRLQFLPLKFSCVSAYLRAYPTTSDSHVVESFLYWSKESLGAKPIVSITHVVVARFRDPGVPEAIVVAKQVFATHYKNGSVTITTITGPPDARYLVYVHRSQLDMLHGMFGAFMRRMIERRVKAEAPGVLLGLRQRLESGDPQ
jgi:hypothetical protein